MDISAARTGPQSPLGYKRQTGSYMHLDAVESGWSGHIFEGKSQLDSLRKLQMQIPNIAICKNLGLWITLCWPRVLYASSRPSSALGGLKMPHSKSHRPRSVHEKSQGHPSATSQRMLPPHAVFRAFRLTQGNLSTEQLSARKLVETFNTQQLHDPCHGSMGSNRTCMAGSRNIRKLLEYFKI